MKCKRFIVIMAILIIICSIQAASALEDVNTTVNVAGADTDILEADYNPSDADENISQALQVTNLDDSEDFPDKSKGDDSVVQLSDLNDAGEGEILSSDDYSDILSLSSIDILTASNIGTFTYGVDYDTSLGDVVPLERFFKALYWGIRDKVQNQYNSGQTVTTEWNVFLNNRTFTGGYGDGGVGTIQTGYLSPGGYRVTYLTFNGMNFNSNIALTIHLYGGKDLNDERKSTIDLTGYGASYALLDFSTENSSISGINFKNFDVNKHPNTLNPDTAVPFIKLGNINNPSYAPELLIHDCTFENITLNPYQPLYEVGGGKELHFDNQYSEYDLEHFFKFVFWRVRDGIKADLQAGRQPTLVWDVFLNNHTFGGKYGSNAISTGYYSWTYTDGHADRANYLTFRNLNPRDNSYMDNLNITVNLYGGNNKYDGKTSTLDLSQYTVDYRLIDLSGGSSTLTGINFINYDAGKCTKDGSATSMPFIFLGDEKIANYKSGLVNCSFENITLNPKQPLVRIAYQDNVHDSSQIVNSAGVIDGCVFKNNSASQMIAISGSVSDSKHSDYGPIFYGFSASNNRFIGNKGNAEFDSNTQSLGFCFKIWNEAVNVTLHNNTFINNTNAVHGAAYCIIGTNVTISDNYIEANQAVFGAGIEAHNGNITIINSRFVDNVASGNHSQHPYRDGSGAAIALLGSNNYIYNCTFINNTAHGHAGAIDIVGDTKTLPDGTKYYLVPDNTVIESSLFYDNIAMDYAGAIHINGTNTLIENCTLENNNASHAGAIKLIGENVTILNSTFENNNAIQGGACYIQGENAQVHNSTFTFNDATHSLSKVRPNATMVASGGAIYVIGSHTTINNNTFANNTAYGPCSVSRIEGLGGAIFIDGENLTFIEGDFKDNVAVQGGAVYVNGNDVNASFMNFTRNLAVQGGAIYIKGHGTVFNNSTFIDNNATKVLPGFDTSGADSLSVCGGAINIIGETTKIYGSYFKSNYAINGDGGAIAIEGHLADIVSNEFAGNEAIHGGAVYLESTSTNSTVSKGNFTFNNAVVGGAIFIRGSNTRITDSNFTDNNATKDLSFAIDPSFSSMNGVGGAIGILGSNSVITNSNFLRNTAIGKRYRSYGGAIAIQGFNTTLDCNGFDSNQAILGGALYYAGSLNDVNDTEFVRNAAIQGGAVYIANSDATFGNSRFYNNSATHDLRFVLESDELKEMYTIGGAISIPGNSIRVDGSEFINNTAHGIYKQGGLGGAIAVNGSDDYITNSRFENNQAIQGGAFFLEGDNVNIIDSNFTDNRAVEGGAGRIDGVNSLVEGSKFTKNYATHDDLRFDLTSELSAIPTVGGAVHIIGKNINISSSEFTLNMADVAVDDASIGAGAIYVEGNNATIAKSSFEFNHALKGGAMFIVVNNTNVVDSTFNANSVTHFTVMEGFGGAVYLENATDSNFRGCVFTNNTASINGGAIDWHEGCIDGEISDCSFTDNTAGANGGAVFWFGEGGIIRNSNFTDNRANGTVICMLGNSGDGGAIMWTGSNGIVDGCIFTDNYAEAHGGAVFLRGVEGRADCINNVFKNSVFENNVAGENGGAIDWNEGAAEGKVINSSFANNSASENGGAVFWNGHQGLINGSNFTKNSASNGGAVYWAGFGGSVDDSRFVSNEAVNGGALYMKHCVHYIDMSVNVIGSYFENNTADEDGGALNWHDGENITVKTSSFINNTARRGGAAFINGNAEGMIKDSEFISNEAVLGGAAYLNNVNAAVESSDFAYNNAIQGGAVYIAGENNRISKSSFNHNNATYDLRLDDISEDYRTKGGAIYVGGKNNIIENSKFYNNTANATNKTAVIVPTKLQLLGAALEVTGVDDDGLGGAIYIAADDNRFDSNEFDYNVARNGSAIYNNASGSYISGGLLVKNQAWSYVLEVKTTPERVYYGTRLPAEVFSYIAGDNILNGIYNAGDVTDITFNNVGYIIDDDVSKVRRTSASDVNPVLGAREGVLYQDSLERYQPIVVDIISDETGETVFTRTVLTDLYGNRTFDLPGLAPGNYTINAYHPEDRNYKYIGTSNAFEIIPFVDISVKKSVSAEMVYVGDEITFTVVAANAFNASEAHNITVSEILPKGMTVLSIVPSRGSYNSTSNTWFIENLANGTNETLTIIIRTDQLGTFENTVEAICDDEEWNYSNNNDTVKYEVIKTDISVVKFAIEDLIFVNDEVTFTINITNNAKLNATDLVVEDFVPYGFEFVESDADYDNKTGILNISSLKAGESFVFSITMKAITNGTLTNIVSVTCAENRTSVSDYADVEVMPVVNLTVVKTVDTDDTAIGDVVTFTIEITNNGPSNATDVVVEDILPAEFRLISGELNQVIPFLASGNSTNITITAMTTVKGHFDNVVNVFCRENETVKSSNATVNVYVTDLKLDKTVDRADVLVNETVKFTIHVRNHGRNPATNVNISDVLDEGFEFISATGDYTRSGQTIVWNIGRLASEESVEVEIVARVVSDGTLDNVAHTNCSEEPTVKNDTATVNAIVDVVLDVVKVADSDDFGVGDTVTFTINVTNNGRSNATNVVVRDFFPEGLERISGDLDYVIPVLHSNETVTFVIVARTTVKGHFDNVVNVTCNELDETITSNYTVNVYVTDLKIEKTVDKTDVVVNETVKFIIHIRNHGRAVATNVNISDVMDEGFEFISASGDYIRDGQTIIWNVGRLASEESFEVEVIARVVSNGTWDNVAHTNCSEEPTVKNDTVTVNAVVDVVLEVIKVANDNDFGVGDTVTFTINVTNNGRSNATNVVVRDFFPEGLERISGDLDYVIPVLHSNETVTYVIVARTTVKGHFDNVVNVTCNELEETLSSNYTVNVYVTDLKIEKTVDKTDVLVNETVKFIIHIRNHGRAVATNVNISDVMDEGFEFISASGDYIRDGQTIIWNVGRLASEESFEVEVVARVVSNGTLDNVAHTNCSEEPTVKNDTVTVNATIDVVLDVEKVANDNDFGVGDTVTFNITVTNKGRSNATNVVVRDIFPEGLERISGDLDYVIPVLHSNETVTFVIVARTVSKGHFDNVVNVTCNELDETVTSNYTVNVYITDLKIDKTADKEDVLINDVITFTIHIRNHGRVVATNVNITDVLEDGFEFINATGDYTRNGQTIVWNVGRLASEESFEVEIMVRAVKYGSFANNATVNCTEEGTVKHSDVTVDVYHKDIEIAKVALDEFVYSGNQTSFRIVVRNIGSVVLHDIFVDEMIPDGLVYDHFIGSNWTVKGTMFTYGGSLAVGESVELIVVVNTTGSGNFTNSIVVGAADEMNYTANASILVYTPSLKVREISNDPKVAVGQPVSFTVIVTNDGDCALGDVYVQNYFPDGLIYTGFDGEKWSKNGNRFTYNGVLNPGESVSYVLHFDTVRPGKFMAEVIAGSNLTSNATKKAYSSNTTVVSDAKIVLTKVADRNSVRVGEYVRFTITVRNVGGSAVGDVFVIDEIPDGLEFISFEGNGWTRHGNTYIYSGILAPGESISFTILCRAVKEGTITNVAIAGSNATGNVSASAEVSVIKEDAPRPVPVKVAIDENATGNPIALLLLVIFAVIPLRRHKK